jgi:hypothetical protein
LEAAPVTSEPSSLLTAPRGKPQFSFYTTLTDERGVARFDAVEHDKNYFARAHFPKYAMVSDNEIDRSTSELRIVLAPVFAVVVNVEGDDLITWSITGVLTNRSLSQALGAIELWDEELRKSHPGSAVCAIVRKSDEAPQAQFQMLLARTGAKKATITAKRLADGNAELVQNIKITPPANSSASAKRCVFYFVDASNRPLDTLRIPLVTNPRSNPMSITVEHGKPELLPFGWYQVGNWWTEPRIPLQPNEISVSMSGPDSFVVKYAEDLEPVQFKVTNGSEETKRGELTLKYKYKDGTTLTLRDLPAMVRWMQPGEVRVKFKGQGFKTKPRDITIEKIERGRIQTFELELESEE